MSRRTALGVPITAPYPYPPTPGIVIVRVVTALAPPAADFGRGGVVVSSSAVIDGGAAAGGTVVGTAPAALPLAAINGVAGMPVSRAYNGQDSVADAPVPLVVDKPPPPTPRIGASAPSTTRTARRTAPACALGSMLTLACLLNACHLGEVELEAICLAAGVYASLELAGGWTDTYAPAVLAHAQSIVHHIARKRSGPEPQLSGITPDIVLRVIKLVTSERPSSLRRSWLPVLGAHDAVDELGLAHPRAFSVSVSAGLRVSPRRCRSARGAQTVRAASSLRCATALSHRNLHEYYNYYDYAR